MRVGGVLRVHAIGIALLSLLACGKDAAAPPGPVGAELRLRPSLILLNQLDSVQVVATVLDKSGVLLTGIPVTFESSAPTIVSVSSIGMVTSVGPAGTATITARAPTITATVPVTVGAVPTRLSLTPAPGVLPQKGTLQLVAQLLDRLGTAIPGAPITLTSSDTTLLVIASDGKATSVGPAGQVTVSARSGDYATTAEIAITQVPTSIRVTPSDVRMGRNRSLRIIPQVLDAVGTPMPGITNFVYTSQSPALFTVSANGTITSLGAVGTGVVRVTAPEPGLNADVPVEVLAASSPVGTTASVINISGPSYAVAFTTGDSVVSVSYAAVSAVVSAETRAVRFLAGASEIYGVAYDITRNSSFFVTRGRALFQLNHATGIVTQLLALPGTGEVFSVAMSADGSKLFVGTIGGDVDIVDLTTRAVARISSTFSGALHLTVHPDGRRIYTSMNGGISELNIATGLTRAMNVSGGYWQATAVTSDGRYLFAVSETNLVRRFDLTDNTSNDVAISCGGWGLGITRDDRYLYVSCGEQGSVLVLDAATRAQVNRIDALGDVRRIAMSIDGTIAAVGSSRGVVLIR